jgi:flagellar motor switch protein FliN/FliY
MDDADDILNSLEEDFSADEAPAASPAPAQPPAPAPGSAAATLGSAPGGRAAFEALYDVSVDVVAILGTADLAINQILKLGRGAVVELDRAVGEPIEIRANRRLIARGEVVVIEDRLGVQVTEVIMGGEG